jgi:hypothetical protein
MLWYTGATGLPQEPLLQTAPLGHWLPQYPQFLSQQVCLMAIDKVKKMIELLAPHFVCVLKIYATALPSSNQFPARSLLLHFLPPFVILFITTLDMPAVILH